MTDQFTCDLKLNREEYDALIFAIGMATGIAFKMDNNQLAYSILNLANRINSGNPNWQPYEIPEEFRRGFEGENDANAQGDGDKPLSRGKRKAGPAFQ